MGAPAGSNDLEILKLLATGVTAAFVTQVFTWIREHRKDKANAKRAASYSALRLAVVFEQFSIACAHAMSDTKLFLSSGSHAGSLQTKIPPLPPFPDDVDWSILELCLAAPALAIRNELVIAQQSTDFWYEVENENVPGAAVDELGICGYRAWEIAAGLRAHYAIPAFDPTPFGWDVRDYLEKQYKAALAKREGSAKE